MVTTESGQEVNEVQSKVIGELLLLFYCFLMEMYGLSVPHCYGFKCNHPVERMPQPPLHYSVL